jgi:hypothetical protein
MDAKHGKQTGDRPGSEPSGGTDTTEIRLPGASVRLACRSIPEDRITLRSALVEDLTDENCYDLAWVPVMFLPADVAAKGLHRVGAALRPGGWAVLSSLAAEGKGLQPAVLRLMSLLFGSGSLFSHHAAEMLSAAG